MNDRRSLDVRRAFSCQFPSHSVARINHTIVPAKLNEYFHISVNNAPRCLLSWIVCLTTFVVFYYKHFGGLETDATKFETTVIIPVKIIDCLY